MESSRVLERGRSSEVCLDSLRIHSKLIKGRTNTQAVGLKTSEDDIRGNDFKVGSLNAIESILTNIDPKINLQLLPYRLSSSIPHCPMPTE